jgi:hypothetical protein
LSKDFWAEELAVMGEVGKPYLSCCIDNLGRVVLALISDYFAKGVLDGGIVALDEVAIDKLYCK